jgi:FtsP/CotA-like multicopper oxidase with cupredoxin domain
LRVVLTTVTVAVVLGALTGCGDGEAAGTTSAPDSPSVSAPVETTSSAPPAADIVTIDVTIAGGQVEPPPTRVDVRVGQTVRITVTSDEPGELHVHGYDIEVELTPGQPGTVELVADQTGLFEVETHEQGLQLLQLVVQ